MLNIKQFPSGNYDIDGIFILKHGTLKESAQHQLKLLQGRYRYDKSVENTRVMNELKRIIKELTYSTNLQNNKFGGVF